MHSYENIEGVQSRRERVYRMVVFINMDAPTTDFRFNVMDLASGHDVWRKLNVILTNPRR